MKNKIRILISSSVISSTLLFSHIGLAAPIQDPTLDRLMQLADIKTIIKQTNVDLQPMYQSQAEAIVKNALDLETLDAKQKSAAEKIAVLLSSLTSSITEDPAFYTMLKNAYKKTFSEEEAQAYIGFLSTPMGQSISKKSVTLMSDVNQQSKQFAETALQDPKKKTLFLAQFKLIMQPLIEAQEKAKP